ncbi:MAG: hypothetical protein ACRDK5_05650 [Solirubrobacterales bacterium]
MEENDSTSLLLRVRGRLGMGLLLALCSIGIAGCGGGERQDADEPEGEFPVDIVNASFASKQRLAETSDLTLSIANTGEETIPDLAITIWTDAEAAPGEGDTTTEESGPKAQGSFSVLSAQPNLAIPSRPVWILEEGYPKLAGETASAGAEAAQTDTFSFGQLDPNEPREIVWRLTPVQPGTYTVHYRIAAGLQGDAVAVTDDGSIPEGEFVVVISDVPPQTRVDDSGNVVPIEKGDIIGQAGTEEQKSEVGGSGGTSTSP